MEIDLEVDEHGNMTRTCLMKVLYKIADQLWNIHEDDVEHYIQCHSDSINEYYRGDMKIVAKAKEILNKAIWHEQRNLG